MGFIQHICAMVTYIMLEQSTRVGLYIAAALLLTIIVILLLKRWCNFSCNGNLNDLLNNALFEEIGQEQDHSRLSPRKRRQMLEERRFLILTGVVHKKVLSKKHVNGMEPYLPHVSSSFYSGRSDLDSSDDSFNEKETGIGYEKSNILIESMRRWHSSMQEVDIESDSSTIYSPRKCSICLEKYKPGDEICWSKNPNCYHVFHLDCLMEWLMKSNECPLCRVDYLNCKGEDIVDGTTSARVVAGGEEDNIEV